MADTQGIYFELSETLAGKLEERIDDIGVSKREYFESYVRDDTEHITLDDPRAELAEIERQLEGAQEDLEELRDEEKEMRDSIKSLEQRRDEVEERLDDAGVVTAGSYDDAVEALIDRAVDDGIFGVDSTVQRVAEDWARDPQTVCRDVYESSIRVTGSDVTIKGPYGGDRVPEKWEKELPDYHEAIAVLSEDVFASGALTADTGEIKRLSDWYESELESVAVDILGEINGDDVEIEVVETGTLGDYPDAGDAPEADLVLGGWIADKIGFEE